MATLLFFAQAREVAGTRRATIEGATVGEVVAAAVAQFGDALGRVVPHCKVWVNGEPAEDETSVGPTDEVALLPPVSGGAVASPVCAPITAEGPRTHRAISRTGGRGPRGAFPPNEG